jgi:hypothetical protein
MSSASGRRSTLVRVVYTAGLAAVALPIVAALAVVAVFYVWQPESTYGFYLDVSSVTFAIWIGVILLALGTWLWQRYGARR